MVRNKKKRKKLKKDKRMSTWIESDGVHSIMPGKPPSPEMMDKISKKFQENIRKSPLWDEMVKKYGRKKAEELLKEFRAELR
jgi:hypothetical protein